MTEKYSRSSRDVIHVYCIRTDTQNVSVSAIESRTATVIRELPATKHERLTSIIPIQSRVHSALGWLLVRYAIHRLGFSDFTLSEIVIDQNHKPRWRSGRCDFNVTHTGSLVACAVSTSGRVGIDCERVRPIDARAMLRRILSPHEPAPDGPDLSVFFRLWTQKEAVIKAEGNGGVWNMRRVTLSDRVAHYQGTNWYVCPLSLKDDYVGHVASDRAEACITMHAVSVEELLNEGVGGNRPASTL